MSSYMQKSIKKFNKANGVWIAYIEQEKGAIIRTSVFCVDKSYFPRPGHKCYAIHFHYHTKVFSITNSHLWGHSYKDKLLMCYN